MVKNFIKTSVDSSEVEKIISTFTNKLKERCFSSLISKVKTQVRDAAVSKGGRTLWKQIGNSIDGSSTNERIDITSDHPAADIRDKGGVIRARNKRYLTVPIDSAAKGKTVAQVRRSGWKIFRIKGKEGGYLLGKRGIGRTALLFALRRSVRHPADKWIPTNAKLFKTADEVFGGLKI